MPRTTRSNAEDVVSSLPDGYERSERAAIASFLRRSVQDDDHHATDPILPPVDDEDGTEIADQADIGLLDSDIGEDSPDIVNPAPDLVPQYLGVPPPARVGRVRVSVLGPRRHHKILRDNLQSISTPSIRRLARRGGVKVKYLFSLTHTHTHTPFSPHPMHSPLHDSHVLPSENELPDLRRDAWNLESIFTEHSQGCRRLLRTQTHEDRYRGERPPRNAHAQTKPEANFTFMSVRVSWTLSTVSDGRALCCGDLGEDAGRGGVCTHLRHDAQTLAHDSDAQSHYE